MEDRDSSRWVKESDEAVKFMDVRLCTGVVQALQTRVLIVPPAMHSAEGIPTNRTNRLHTVLQTVHAA